MSIFSPVTRCSLQGAVCVWAAAASWLNLWNVWLPRMDRLQAARLSPSLTGFFYGQSKRDFFPSLYWIYMYRISHAHCQQYLCGEQMCTHMHTRRAPAKWKPKFRTFCTQTFSSNGCSRSFVAPIRLKCANKGSTPRSPSSFPLIPLRSVDFENSRLIFTFWVHQHLTVSVVVVVEIE